MMNNHAVTICNILVDDLRSAEPAIPYWRWVHRFAADAAVQIVEIAGPDSDFKASMDALAGLDITDRPAVCYEMLERYAPDRHEVVCEVLRPKLHKAFVAELHIVAPTMARDIGADFARLVTNCSRPGMLVRCLQDYRGLTDQRADGLRDEDNFHYWECYSFKSVLSMIDPDNEIRWLLRLT